MLPHLLGWHKTLVSNQAAFNHSNPHNQLTINCIQVLVLKLLDFYCSAPDYGFT
jgi:hypothetical protein